MTVCRAQLSCRSPPRLSRCRVVWPEEAGIGATPARRAKAASERTRPGCDQLTISWAATIGLLSYYLGSAAGDAIGHYGLIGAGVVVVLVVLVAGGMHVVRRRMEQM